MELLAHSARPKDGIPPQPYAEHVQNVLVQAEKNAREAAKYSRCETERLIRAVRLAAEFHDLGKLDRENQIAFARGSTKTPLPINHADAGVAHLFTSGPQDLLAATLVYAHHAGLPDFQDQRNNKKGWVLRDATPIRQGNPLKIVTDQRLQEYIEEHLHALGSAAQEGGPASADCLSPVQPLFYRIALSCIVDADHHDTARHYNKAIAADGPCLQPARRLGLLDAHIAYLAHSDPDERSAIRNAVYQACRNASPNAGLFACDSPVGTGKTTAVMAHLLRAAAEKKLRRVFVVLPFTNIIDQSVGVYRRALVGLGEEEEDVVAAHHHRAEFDDPESRQFAFLWQAPIVVTTAVQFFETLASNHPAALRKLHQLPGSAVFIDEAHAALPSHLWPQAWRWLRELESEWGCHFVLGSGSLNRFWELEEFSDPPARLPELVSETVRKQASDYEGVRVRYRSSGDTKSLDELLECLWAFEGPRLLIVNTVQSAAAITAEIAQRKGRQSVEHLSTALCPRDRERTLDCVKERLADKRKLDWTLVATSCVEAGLDLSFRTGLRERCSHNSLIQVGGRVNRGGEYADGQVWDFQLRHEGLLRPHPAFDTSASVLAELLKEGRVGPQSATEAMKREVRRDGLKSACDEILKAERHLQFPTVAKEFRVIDSDTVTAIVDPDLIAKLERREKVNANEIQALSVQIWRSREIEYALEPLERYPSLRAWKLAYDTFLGYMAGVFEYLRHKQEGSIV